MDDDRTPICGWCKKPWHPQEQCEVAQKAIANWGSQNPEDTRQ